MLELCSRQMGEAARGLLTPGACGQVLAGFSTSAYLVTEQAELFWLASEDAPMHTRGLRIAGPFPRLVAGERFFIEGERINIGPNIQVDFADGSPWAVPRIPVETALRIDQVPLRVTSFFATTLDLSQATGLGRLIPRILSLTAGQPDEEAETDPVLARAWPSVRAIAEACLLGDMSGLLREARDLVGLGEGLTPSGDDFLGGLLFCAGTIQRRYPGLIDLDSSEQARFLESARQRTNLISFTLLEDLAGGQAVEPLHELVHSILSKQPQNGIGPLSCLTEIGHSTGWDLLAGVLTGLLVTFGSRASIDSPAVLSAQYVRA